MNRPQPGRLPPRQTGARRKDRNIVCLVVTFKVILIIGLAFGLTYNNLRVTIFKSTSHTSAGSGQISVQDFTNDFSTYLCQSYTVEPYNPADVFSLPERAKVDFDVKVTVRRNGRQLVPGSGRTENSFYLLEGSDIRASACVDDDSRRDLHILLFKGSDSYNNWLFGDCMDCTIMKEKVKACTKGQSQISYYVYERGSYFVAVADDNKQATVVEGITADAEIKHTNFDLRNAHMVCSNSLNCDVPLHYASHMDIVLSFEDGIQYSSFSSDCSLRVKFWVGIFAILPGCIIVLTLFLGACYMCVKRRHVKTETSVGENTCIVNDKANLVKSEMPPSYNECVGSSPNV